MEEDVKPAPLGAEFPASGSRTRPHAFVHGHVVPKPGQAYKRWRYYVSQAALQGDKSKAGSIVRVPAPELEALVTEAVGKLSADHPASQSDIRDRIDRVAIGRTAIQIRLSEVGEGDDSVKTLTLPWTAPLPYRRREIIQGASDATTTARPSALTRARS